MQGHKQPLDCDEDGKASTSGHPIDTTIYIRMEEERTIKEEPIDLDTTIDIKTEEENITIKEEPIDLDEWLIGGWNVFDSF